MKLGSKSIFYQKYLRYFDNKKKVKKRKYEKLLIERQSDIQFILGEKEIKYTLY